MTLGGQYQVLYTDTMSGAVHGILPVESLSFSHVLNGAGSISCTMPLESTNAARLTNQVAWPRIEAGKLEVDGRTTLYVLRDNVPLWSGQVWTRDVNPESNALTVGGEGWLSYWRRRHIYHTRTYSATEQVDIAEDLLTWAMARTGSAQVNLANTVTSGVTRDRRYYKTDFKSVGEAIEQLAAVEGGFDFRFTPEWNAGSLRTTFHVAYPAGGRSTEIVLELGTNVNLLSERADGTTVSTTNWATGVGTGRSMLRKWNVDLSRNGTVPRLEKVRAYSDVSVASTLQAHADLDAIRGKVPLSHIELELLPGTLPGIGSYLVGDRMRVKGAHGYFSVDGTYRSTEQSVTVDSSGEAVKLSLAPLELFI